MCREDYGAQDIFQIGAACCIEKFIISAAIMHTGYIGGFVSLFVRKVWETK